VILRISSESWEAMKEKYPSIVDVWSGFGHIPIASITLPIDSGDFTPQMHSELQDAFNQLSESIQGVSLNGECSGLFSEGAKSNVYLSSVRLDQEFIQVVGQWARETLQPMLKDLANAFLSLKTLDSLVTTVRRYGEANEIADEISDMSLSSSFSAQLSVTSLDVNLSKNNQFTEKIGGTNYKMKKRVNAAQFHRTDCPNEPFFFNK